MPKQIFGAESVVTTLNRAFNDVSPSNATFNNQVSAAGTTADSFTAFAKQYGAGYAGQTADALSTLLLNNLGLLPNTALQAGLKDYITAAGVSNIGIIALQLGDILSGLENATGDQAAFKAAAVAWNAEVTAAYNYSSNPANTTPSDAGPITNPGSTFSLVVGADTISPTSADTTKKSTSGNDTFRADATLNSLETLDTLDGGAGTDTLNVKLGATAKPVLANIEIINVTTDTGAADLQLGDAAGVQQVWSKGGTKALTVTDVALTTTVGLTGAVAETVDFVFKNATGSSDTATLALNAGVVAAGKAVTIAAVETLNIAASGAASTVDTLTAAAVKTINVTGTSTGPVTLGGTYGGLTKFDASGYKGDLTANLSSATAGVTVSTGVGVNKITLSAGALGDTIKFTASNTSTINKLSEITAFHAINAGTEDKIDLSSFALGADTTVATSAVVPAGDIAGFFSGTGRIAKATSGADTFVYVDTNKDGNFNAGTDLAVKLVGVAAADVAIADFILA